MSRLADRSCRPGVQQLGSDELDRLLVDLPDWRLHDGGRAVVRECRFRDFHEVMTFLNALAEIAHREDHHPDMSVHYNRVIVSFTTHDAGGLTENDLICAAKLDALLGVLGNR